MRKLIFPLFALLALASCQSENTVEISGTYVAGAGKSLVLKHSINNKQSTLDSVVVKENGKFSIEFPFEGLDFVTLSDLENTYVLLAKSGEEIEIDFGNNLYEVNRFKGPLSSEKFQEVNLRTITLNQEREKLNKRFQQGELSQEEAMAEYNAINESWQDYARSFVDQNPSSPAILAVLSAFHPIEDIDIYRQSVTALKPVMGQSDYVKRLEQQLLQNEAQAAQYERQKKIEAEREKLLGVGKEAPEIALPDPNGKEIKLSSPKGKYVLVDFWASWCKPCRAENPNVVAAYKKYKNKGFEILSVSLDKSKGAWTNAIAADNMNWKHVSDLKFWNSEAAQTYGVNSIPFTLLLDPEGKIVAKNLRGPALHNKLEELLNG